MPPRMLSGRVRVSQEVFSFGLRMRSGACFKSSQTSLSSKLHVPPPLYRRVPHQAFSAGSTGFVQEQQPPATITNKESEKGASVLVSAAEEAKRLSDLAAKNRSSFSVKTVEEPRTAAVERTVTEDTLQNALEAAQALLIVTFRSSPLLDAIQQKQSSDDGRDIQEQISCLHRAFLAVTSWCLDVVEVSKDPRILDKTLDIAKRAHQLQLAFHLPLYQRLMRVVAQHYAPTANNKNSAVASTILDISSRATAILGPSAIQSSDFFQDSLLQLVRRRRWRDVVLVLQGMEYQHGIAQLELSTLSEMLTALEEFVQGDDSKEMFVSTGDWQDEADFIEILSLLNPYLWKSMSKFTTLSEMLEGETVKSGEPLLGISTSHVEKKGAGAQERDKSKSEAATGQKEKEGELKEEEGEEIGILPVLPSYLKNATIPSRRRRSYRERDELLYYRSLIYGRTPFSALDEDERFPDITAQLAKLIDEMKETENEEEIRYSDEYEKVLLKRLISDDDEATLGESMVDHLDFDDEDDDDSFFDFDEDDFSDDSDDEH